jgi:hypothetical protein
LHLQYWCLFSFLWEISIFRDWWSNSLFSSYLVGLWLLLKRLLFFGSSCEAASLWSLKPFCKTFTKNDFSDSCINFYEVSKEEPG